MQNTDAIAVSFSGLATNLADLVIDSTDGQLIDELGQCFSRTELALFMAQQVAYAISPDDGSPENHDERETFLFLFRERVRAKAVQVSASFDAIDPWGDLPVDDD